MKKGNYSINAIISFALGIFTLIFLSIQGYLQYAGFIFFFILSILEIVLGFVGLNQIKKNQKLKGKLFAFLGIILGFLSIIYAIFLRFSILF